MNVSEDGHLGCPSSCKKEHTTGTVSGMLFFAAHRAAKKSIPLTVPVRPLLHVTHSQSCVRAISPFNLWFALFCDEQIRAQAQPLTISD